MIPGAVAPHLGVVSSKMDTDYTAIKGAVAPHLGVVSSQ